MIYLQNQNCFVHDGFIYHISKNEFENNIRRGLEFKDFEEFLNSEEGTKGFLSVICVSVDLKKKTEYAELMDHSRRFSVVNRGKRIINGQWQNVERNFKKGNAYLLWIEKNNNYPDDFRLIACKELGQNK